MSLRAILPWISLHYVRCATMAITFFEAALALASTGKKYIHDNANTLQANAFGNTARSRGDGRRRARHLRVTFAGPQ